MRTIQSQPTFKRRTLLLGMVGSVVQLTGCGGGGSDVAGLSTGGTGSFTSGTISGLGSIIVNGIRYDNRTANLISRDDGTSLAESTLKVGMVVDIAGSLVTAASTAGGTATATAYRISCGSEWEGPVTNILADSFDILGLTVEVSAGTVFEGSNVAQLSDLTLSHYVEVHGYVNPTSGHLQATHVEVSTTAPALYKLSGAVNNWDWANKTFTLGSAGQRSTGLSWEGATSLPHDWTPNMDVNGIFVRVTLDATTRNNPTLLATQVRVPTSPLTELDVSEQEDVQIHGFISTYASKANFIVNGITVDASNVAGGDFVVGQRVEVHGSIRNGVLIATKVETPNDASLHEFEFHGTVSNWSESTQTFNLHGLTFSYVVPDTSIEGVTMGNGISIQIKAIRSSGNWLATEIRADA
jgi:hypothetical protein